jgi:hypothetical protein
MDYLNNLLEKKNMPQLVLVVLFIIYLTMGPYKTPDNVASLIVSNPGKIVVALVALILFAYSNPILGVLGIMVAYHLIQSSHIKTGMSALAKYYPTETKKWTPFNATHQFPYTLEQEMVKKMTTQKFYNSPTKSSFKPTLDENYDAAPINYTGPN